MSQPNDFEDYLLLNKKDDFLNNVYSDFFEKVQENVISDGYTTVLRITDTFRHIETNRYLQVVYEEDNSSRDLSSEVVNIIEVEPQEVTTIKYIPKEK